jgi:hypothetical protein
VELFFQFAYALVIFCAFALVGALPGFALGLVAPRAERRLLLPGVLLATAGWIWAGWLGSRYGISRIGLVLFAGVGALGFVQGWAVGIRAAVRARARRSRTPGSLR